ETLIRAVEDRLQGLLHPADRTREVQQGRRGAERTAGVDRPAEVAEAVGHRAPALGVVRLRGAQLAGEVPEALLGDTRALLEAAGDLGERTQRLGRQCG